MNNVNTKRGLVMLFGVLLTGAGAAAALFLDGIQLNVATVLIAFGYGAVGYAARAEDADAGDF